MKKTCKKKRQGKNKQREEDFEWVENELKNLMVKELKSKMSFSTKENPTNTILLAIHKFPIIGKKRQISIDKGIETAFELQEKLFGHLGTNSKSIESMFSNLIAIDFLVRMTAMNLKVGMALAGKPLETNETFDEMKGYV